MKLLENTINKINYLDKEKMNLAQERLNNLTKPEGSLGKLEELAVKLSGITGKTCPEIINKYHIVMAGDHGVAGEGVSAYPQELTTQMVYNFLQEGAAINVLASQAEAELKIVDTGMINTINKDIFKEYPDSEARFIEKRIRAGTDNMVNGPAMSREEAITSIENGIKVVNEVIADGADLIGVGEMGIGNTTPATAITGVIMDLPLEKLVGYGTGIDETRKKHKQETIAKALEVNQPNSEDGIDILSKVGGFEIGGMAGVMLGAAASNIPVIIDGLICTSAALIAAKIKPEVTTYFIPSHKSEEPAHEKIYKYLNLKPMLYMNMRLGEGTGAVLTMNLVEAATNIISDMATFDDLS